jgi:hypothetical protein
VTSQQKWARLLDAVSRPSAVADRDALLSEAVSLGLDVAPGSVGCSITQQIGSDYRTPVASGPLAMDLDLAQYRAGDGPCIAAARTGRHYRIKSMTAEADFPEFTAAAKRHGVHSSSSVPLLGSARPAALNLYASDPNAFDSERPVAVSSLLARCVTGLLRAAPVSPIAGEIPEVATSMTDALTKRELIERAQGVLMRRDGLTESEAFAWLTHRSTDQLRSIFDVARAVLATDPAQGR